MKTIRWDEQKNGWLKQNRGLGFEQVAVLIEQGQVLEVMDHPDQKKYPRQKMAIVEIDRYACLIPYVDDEQGVFLKTIIPSRKATKKYLRGQK
ncbi:MAG: toxin [Kiritimatiellia bacterium]|nr:toxin [Kiritimatiellia bacterium]